MFSLLPIAGGVGGLVALADRFSKLGRTQRQLDLAKVQEELRQLKETSDAQSEDLESLERTTGSQLQNLGKLVEAQVDRHGAVASAVEQLSSGDFGDDRVSKLRIVLAALSRAPRGRERTTIANLHSLDLSKGDVAQAVRLNLVEQHLGVFAIDFDAVDRLAGLSNNRLKDLLDEE